MKIQTTRYLAYVVAVAHKIGWIPRKSATDESRATADVALDCLMTGRSGSFELLEPDQNDHTQAGQMLSWIRFADFEDPGRYLERLQNVCRKDELTPEDFGLAASLYPTYGRHLISSRKEAKIREEMSRKSEFIGRIGSRIEVTATIKKQIPHGVSNYGGVTKSQMLYLFEDVDGNLILWKTEARDFSSDSVIILSGKVKAHKKLDDEIPYTEITRATIH